MKSDSQVLTKENDVISVGVSDEKENYFLWQRGLTKATGLNDGVYFEFNDQSTGGYNTAQKAIIKDNGVEVTLSNSEILFLLFPRGFENQESLRQALREIYQGTEHEQMPGT